MFNICLNNHKKNILSEISEKISKFRTKYFKMQSSVFAKDIGKQLFEMYLKTENENKKGAITMYICRQCNHIFEEGEGKIIKENQGECFGYPAFESYTVCPICEGEYEEAVRCSICEEYHLEEDLTNGICDSCLDKEVDYDKVLKFLLGQGELDYFVFKFFFTEKTFGDNLQKAINDELTWWFKRKVFDERLNNKTEFLDILKKYLKTDPYGWSEFLSEGVR